MYKTISEIHDFLASNTDKISILCPNKKRALKLSKSSFKGSIYYIEGYTNKYTLYKLTF
jgi:hypothetical protein